MALTNFDRCFCCEAWGIWALVCSVCWTCECEHACIVLFPGAAITWMGITHLWLSHRVWREFAHCDLLGFLIATWMLTSRPGVFHGSLYVRTLRNKLCALNGSISVSAFGSNPLSAQTEGSSQLPNYLDKTSVRRGRSIFISSLNLTSMLLLYWCEVAIINAA